MGKSVFVVPGNHDLRMSHDPDDHLRFMEEYSAFGWDEAYSKEETTSSYAVELKDGYVLLGINPNKAGGDVTSIFQKIAGFFEWLYSLIQNIIRTVH